MNIFALGLPHGSEWLFVIIYFAIVIAVPVFLVFLLWRITNALEQIARHQLEIARGVKKLAHASENGEEE